MSFAKDKRQPASRHLKAVGSVHANAIEEAYHLQQVKLWNDIEQQREQSPERKRCKLSGDPFVFTMKDGKPLIDGRVYAEARSRLKGKIKDHPSCACKWANVSHDRRRPQVAIRGLWGANSSKWSEVKVYAYTAMALTDDEVPPAEADTSHRCNNSWCVKRDCLCFEANLYNSTRRYCFMFDRVAMCGHVPPCIDTKQSKRK